MQFSGFVQTIPSSGGITTPSLGVITQSYDSHLHEKIEQLEKWLFDVLNNCTIDLPEETYSAMIQWKENYCMRKRIERDERIVCLQEQTQKMLDELKRLQDES